MALVPNLAKARLADGRVALGLGVGALALPAIAPLAQAGGYDWLAIDSEHGALTLREIADLSVAALAAGVTPIVRVNASALSEATRALDNGAQGIIVPSVSSAAEARRIADALRFPPLGHRNWTTSAAHFRYDPPPVGEARDGLEREVLVIAMIETAQGVDAAAEIAAVAGIDALFVGAVDLSIALGIPGAFGHPRMLGAVGAVATACRDSGVAFGFGGVADDRWIGAYAALGATLIAVSGDAALLLGAARARTQAVTELLVAGSQARPSTSSSSSG